MKILNLYVREPIVIYEWYGKYDINDDNKDEEIIAFVSPKYKVLLGWRRHNSSTKEQE